MKLDIVKLTDKNETKKIKNAWQRAYATSATGLTKIEASAVLKVYHMRTLPEGLSDNVSTDL